MRLEIGSFPVNDLAFGKETRWRAGALEVNRDELVRLATRDPRISKADVELARPGESARVTKVRDVIEPRIKVEGPGTVYPGVCGRSMDVVGQGKTHRLKGAAVVEIADVRMYDRGFDHEVETYFDMGGTGAEFMPYGTLLNVCLLLDVDRTLHIQDQNEALHAAALRVSDRLAATVREQEPPEREVFELPPVDPSLPRLAYIICLRSSEHYSGSVSAHWCGIYGLTRLTAPWLLHPNELLDGAISVGQPHNGLGTASWALVNNPILLDLYRAHGRESCFAGVIAIRTRWSAQREKDLTAAQAAKMAQMLGASGVVLTYDAGGNDFMEVIRTLQCCERAGIKTVLVTSESQEAGGGPPILEPVPEAVAIVSTGTRGNLRFARPAAPPVERVIGPRRLVADPAAVSGQIDPKDGVPYYPGNDIYGFSRESCMDY